MAIPVARVKIEVLTIKSVPPARLRPGDTRWARALFVNGNGPTIATGRSRPIPDAGGDFDVSGEASPWVFEADVQPGWEVYVGVELHEDRGTDTPPAAQVMTMTPPLLGLGFGIIEVPWTSGVRTFGQVEVRVTTDLMGATDRAYIARATDAAKPSGTLAVYQGYLVEIADVVGLYKPTGPYRPGFPLPAEGTIDAGAKRVPFYTSEDNRGRIYTNRLPDGTWASDTQYIDVHVNVKAFGGATIPAGARIDWIIEDADEPTNDAEDFHRDWGPYIDPSDYDPSGIPLGAHAEDNVAAFAHGNGDESKLFGAATSSPGGRWAATPADPAPSVVSRNRADSALKLVNPTKAQTSVRIHCMNVLGTNLRVRAELIGGDAGVPVFNAASGVMTMWNRIDVEVVRMEGAKDINGAVREIPKYFLPCCVQLDFHAERMLTGDLAPTELAGGEGGVLEETARQWVSRPEVFSHGTEKGWFFLAAARLPYKRPPENGVLYNDHEYELSGEAVEIPGDLGTASYVQFFWTGAGGQKLSAGFQVRTTEKNGEKTKIWLYGNDVTPEFTGHDSDGSSSHAYASKILYYPRTQQRAGGPAVPGGFGIPESGAAVRVRAPGATIVSGESPRLKNASHPDEKYFAGRTIVFTEAITGDKFNEEIVSTVVHEFVHAFGMPHKCGYWDWRAGNSKRRSCCMNYFNTWVADGSHHLIPGTMGKVGADVCGRHLMEVRRVHLEKNLGLNW